MSNTHSTYRLIKSFEAKELKTRNWFLKFADQVASFFGSIEFFIINALFFSSWIVINTGLTPLPIFDHYPFTMLTTIVSLEAIFLTIIVLIAQNRQSYVSTLREELHLQINLISEKEITKILRLLHDLNRHHKILMNDPELEDMIKDLDASYIERQLEKQLAPPKTNTFNTIVTQPVKKVAKEIENTFKVSP